MIRLPGTNTVAFYPFSKAGWGNPEYGTTIAGGTIPGNYAATALALPAALVDHPDAYASGCRDINSGNNLGFEGDASNQDQLHFYNHETHTVTKYSWYNGDWYEMPSMTIGVRDVCPGDGFYYLNFDDDTFTWYPNQ